MCQQIDIKAFPTYPPNLPSHLTDFELIVSLGNNHELYNIENRILRISMNGIHALGDAE